ncbi:glutamate racemase [Leuconostocaceae bacterium ESL0723]|nr:glutamate racemase [Leuconostocaceae bacterium ESL0723]
MKNNQAIGMFDSGVGGLTVLKAAEQLLPHEQFIYVGDTARMPYGPRSAAEIVQYSNEIADFLVNQFNIKLLVIACNTATARALPTLQERLSIPVIGVIDAGAQAAAKASPAGKIGLIATKGTVDSKRYQEELADLAPQATVLAQAEPDFVKWVEADRFEDSSLQAAVDQHLAPLKDAAVDTLILGCTHFPLMADLIQAAVGPSVALIDAGKATAQFLKQYLAEHGLANQSQKVGASRLFTTGDLAAFETIAQEWLGQQPGRKIEHLDLSQTQV